MKVAITLRNYNCKINLKSGERSNMLHTEVSQLILRKPRKQDGAAVWELIDRAGTLDLNSIYCYMLLCDLYRDTCIVAERDGRLLGFVSALRPPQKAHHLFIWQVAVDPSRRGQGLGTAMVTRLLEQVRKQQDVRYIEATISPSNTASRRLFEAVARSYGSVCSYDGERGYPEGLFPSSQPHEAEPLVTIGPIR
ncbi:diaminobutyrate acetyltransferase [Paenibacillus sp. SYP-B4298]|uniref:diaminobutyrate acetyltransferase n=1 Tax=Paenibacillus sp. SYP-B4298 TaxID=2996034 RepID=UPI0022DCEA9F|nr:diaminobutyrate acetyltransferase [Paenibacillus sp. SYP-B4298]